MSTGPNLCGDYHLAHISQLIALFSFVGARFHVIFQRIKCLGRLQCWIPLRVRLEFHGSKIRSDGGLLLFCELDKTLELHDLAGRSLRDTRTGTNGIHNFVGLLRQSPFGRLAGYADVNDADRLSGDPVMRQIVGGRAVDNQAASTSQMARFKTDILASDHNRDALATLLHGYGSSQSLPFPVQLVTR